MLEIIALCSCACLACLWCVVAYESTRNRCREKRVTYEHCRSFCPQHRCCIRQCIKAHSCASRKLYISRCNERECVLPARKRCILLQDRYCLEGSPECHPCFSNPTRGCLSCEVISKDRHRSRRKSRVVERRLAKSGSRERRGRRRCRDTGGRNLR